VLLTPARALRLVARSIAAADGIEYMESQSTLGLSTIKVRLKLNYDPTKVNVTAVNNVMLLAANGGFIPIDFSNPVPEPNPPIFGR